jgi:Protein of unknown function (DUF2806)
MLHMALFVKYELIMTNEIGPTSQGGLASFIEKLNLPAIIAGPAGTAIARLIGGLADIPVAYLEGFARQIRNKNNAREIVSKELSNAAARFVAADNELAERAAYSLIAKEYRRQSNKENIAVRTIEVLQDELNDSAQQSAAAGNQEAPSYVDQDWLNVFERYAEDASTERLQSMWGRVLAGEIRRPRSFSLRTLRFISELDITTAQLFEKHAKYIFNSSFIPKGPQGYQLEGTRFSELLRLQETGLLSGTEGSMLHSINVPPKFESIGFTNQNIVVVCKIKQSTIQIPAIALTNIGREIYAILQHNFEIAALKEAIELFPKHMFDSIVVPQQDNGKIQISAPIVIWEQPK